MVARSGCGPRSGRYADVRPTLIHTEINEWTPAKAVPALLPPDRLDFRGHSGGTDGMSRFRRQGVRPIKSVDDLAAGVDPFESDEEYEAFLLDLHASRRAGLV
jgi:hypothetical protein